MYSEKWNKYEKIDNENDGNEIVNVVVLTEMLLILIMILLK